MWNDRVLRFNIRQTIWLWTLGALVLSVMLIPDGVGSQSKRPGTVYALLIGINNHKQHSNVQNRWRNLKYSVSDVRGIQDVLVQKGKVPSANIKVVTDKQATTANIVGLLSGWLQRATAKDTVLVFFSGHGKKTADGLVHLVTHNTKKTRLE